MDTRGALRLPQAEFASGAVCVHEDVQSAPKQQTEISTLLLLLLLLLSLLLLFFFFFFLLFFCWGGRWACGKCVMTLWAPHQTQSDVKKLIGFGGGDGWGHVRT